MRYVAYYRVSTVRQGQSGLGLEAQQTAVKNFVGLEASIIAEYVEIESGCKNIRPQLQEAIIRAKQDNSILLVAKLDRLARNVAFLATLMESNVRFKAVDLPAADEFTLHILAAVAQREAKAISTRTKEALAAKKAQGFHLGTPTNLTEEARIKALESLRKNALDNLNNRQAVQIAVLLRATGMSLRNIATRLNESGYRTRRGNAFHPMGVSRLLPS